MAFCAGSKANALPVPAPRLSTVPLYLTSLPYRSALISTGWPIRMSRSWVSLKLASIHTSSSGMTAMVAVPGCKRWPSCTVRLAT
ncbi:hypothetical protein D3C73_1594330 [compost metagenome]